MDLRPVTVLVRVGRGPLRRSPSILALAFFLFWMGRPFLSQAAPEPFLISEVLFAPPGGDETTEYVELRGPPNALFPTGACFVAVEGDAGGNPGRILNVFDLSGERLGGNGHLVILQKNTVYTSYEYARTLVNTGSEPGFGSGGGSSIGHRGWNDLPELPAASVTFLLLTSTNLPLPGDDIDQGNNGVIDTPVALRWDVLDAVGILDEDGAGDIAYGWQNFRLATSPGNGAYAGGPVQSVSFVPRYVARLGFLPVSPTNQWLASDGLTGTPAQWSLGPVPATSPTNYAGRKLDHIGSPNFGAPDLPGVVLGPGTSAGLLEGGPAQSLFLALNTGPVGAVTVELTSDAGLEFAAAPFAAWTNTLTRSLDSTQKLWFQVRVPPDRILDRMTREARVLTRLVSSLDPAAYPAAMPMPLLSLNVRERDWLLINEFCTNPPGTNDAPNEFIELKGSPGATPTNLWLVGLTGEGNAGVLSFVSSLDGAAAGPGGLLLLAAPNHPFNLAAGTHFRSVPGFSQAGGGLPNDCLTLALVSTRSNLVAGVDWDLNDNGTPEGFPADAVILDSVGIGNSGVNALYYSTAVLLDPDATPDAATRIGGNTNAISAAAWIFGELLEAGSSWSYVSPIVGEHNPLTPGGINNSAPRFSPITPVSGVIGDPTNPTISFTVTDGETAGPFLFSLMTTNSAVLPPAAFSVGSNGPGSYLLALSPTGVGYSQLTLLAADGAATGAVTFPYAASAPGRPQTTWHLGASDGSALALADPEFIWIADDEDQRIRLYPRTRSSVPLNEFNFTAELELPDVEAGMPREVDIEASTRFGDVILWIGSHGHAAIGEVRTNRTRLFATFTQGVGPAATLTYVGRYDFLKTDLIAWDRSNGHGKGANYYNLEFSDSEGIPPKAPDGSGFAIEGMSRIPGSTNAAYIGFRAPISPAASRHYALVVPVLNALELASRGGPPGTARFGTPIEFDLYDRGIRSMEGDERGFLIIAGPAGGAADNYPQDFRLYTWSGNPQHAPQQREANLSGLNPEGILTLPPAPWQPSSVFEILSDNGTADFYGDGIPAKNLPVRNFRKCRLDRVALGGIVPPVPIITAFTVSPNGFTLSWRALRGATYAVQRSVTLTAAAWEDVSVPPAATDIQQTVNIGFQPPGFYRVRLQTTPP
jgi:hypothetical protein